MRIHYLQHVPYEDPANILVWAEKKGHLISRTLMYEDDQFPDTDSFDWLIIMGGPMNIYEEDQYPWLAGEKRFIRNAISAGKVVLGICLGAQLISDVLGGRVSKNQYKEIGWFPVLRTPESKKVKIFAGIPEQFLTFHWHGDTFELPLGAIPLAGSHACKNQAFIFGEKVLALQFHPESTHASISRLIRESLDDLAEGPYVQQPDQMLSQHEALLGNENILEKLLNNLAKL